MSNTISLDKIHVVFPKRYDTVFGPRGLNSRTYIREGTHEEFAEWLEGLHECIGQTLSVSEAAVMVGAARPSVMERVQKGKLTMFVFEFTDAGENKRVIRRGRASKIPYLECLAWKYSREKKYEELIELYEELTDRSRDVAVENYEDERERKIEQCIDKEKRRRSRYEQLVDRAMQEDQEIEEEIAEARKKFGVEPTEREDKNNEL